MATKEKMREKAVEYIQHWIGTKFVSNMAESDGSTWNCSGIVQEILKGCGLTPRSLPFVFADELYERYKDKEVEKSGPGCLVFYLIDGKVEHVDIMIDDEYVMGMCLGKEIENFAYICVKMNHISYQDPLKYIIVDPFRE